MDMPHYGKGALAEAEAVLERVKSDPTVADTLEWKVDFTKQQILITSLICCALWEDENSDTLLRELFAVGLQLARELLTPYKETAANAR